MAVKTTDTACQNSTLNRRVPCFHRARRGSPDPAASLDRRSAVPAQTPTLATLTTGPRVGVTAVTFHEGILCGPWLAEETCSLDSLVRQGRTCPIFPLVRR